MPAMPSKRLKRGGGGDGGGGGGGMRHHGGDLLSLVGHEQGSYIQ